MSVIVEVVVPSTRTIVDVVVGGGGGGGVSTPTNLTIGNRNVSTLDIVSSTGADATIPSATDLLSGLQSATDKAKLDGVAFNATANEGTGTNVSFTDGNGFTGIVSTSTTTPTLSITLQDATTGQSGKLTATGWNTFNSKEPPLTFAAGMTRTGNSVSVNTTQNITHLSNITFNGLLKNWWWNRGT